MGGFPKEQRERDETAGWHTHFTIPSVGKGENQNRSPAENSKESRENRPRCRNLPILSAALLL
jgi:hypothetical protein